ncbi:MAG: hypothetical protein HFI90_01715 [Clostridia bacterium]|nr:hypothetical protein [Clostridia bacterium]
MRVTQDADKKRMIYTLTERHEGGVYLMENFKVCLTNPMLYDELHILAAEYSVSVDLLVNLAIKRLIDDVTLIRELREGKIKEESF